MPRLIVLWSTHGYYAARNSSIYRLVYKVYGRSTVDPSSISGIGSPPIMHFSKLLAVASLATVALAHPGPHAHISKKEVARRDGLSKRCASHVARFNEKRWKRNTFGKRSRGNTTVQIQTEAPYYDVIQNDTCVLTPEVTEGPYIWPRSQTLRQDMTEDQPGVPLWLDVGVLDMATCEPLEGVLVDFWHCNATGSYSSFTGLSPNTAFPTLLEQLNITDFDIGTTDIHTDDTTFLRGMWPTDANGMMEMKTIFPGKLHPLHHMGSPFPYQTGIE